MSQTSSSPTVSQPTEQGSLTESFEVLEAESPGSDKEEDECESRTEIRATDTPDISNNKRKFPEGGAPPPKQVCESNSHSAMEVLSTAKDIVQTGNGGSNEAEAGCEHDEEKSSHPAEGHEGLSEMTKIQPNERVHSSVPRPPGPIQFKSITATSVILLWGPPEEYFGSQKFRAICNEKTIETCSNTCVFDTLSPGKSYDFTVVTLGENKQQSVNVSATTYTDIPLPVGLKVEAHINSIRASWRKPEELDPPTYVVSLCKNESCLSTITTYKEEYCFPDLEMEMEYSVNVSVKVENGWQGKVVTESVKTVVPHPEKPKVTSVTATSAEIEWNSPRELHNIPHSFLVTANGINTPTKSCSMNIPDLEPGSEYTINICTELNQKWSTPVILKFHTVVPQPEKPKVRSVTATSSEIEWNSPGGWQKFPYSFEVSIEGTAQVFSTNECSYNIPNLKPGTDYTVNISTKLNGRMSEPVSFEVHTFVPHPEKPKVRSVTTTSAEIEWNSPGGMQKFPYSFEISIEGTAQVFSTNECSYNIPNLKPGTDYTVNISTKLNDRMSEPVSFEVHTFVPQPEKPKVRSVTTTSAEIEWNSPLEVHNILHSFVVSAKGIDMPTKSCNITIPDLEPGTEYTIDIYTELNHKLSKPVTLDVHTAVPQPEKPKLRSVTATSAEIEWNSPVELRKFPYSFEVRIEDTAQIFSTNKCSYNIPNLKPGTNYTVNISTKLNDRMSEPVSIEVHTFVPRPENPIIDSQTATSLKIKWSSPSELHKIPHSFRIKVNGTERTTNSCNMNITDLKPGTEYTISIHTQLNGNLSEAKSIKIHTIVPQPEKPKVRSVTATSAAIEWSSPRELRNIPHSFLVGANGISTPTESCNMNIPDLQPGTEYTISIYTELNQKQSTPVILKFHTEIPTKKFYTIVIGNTQMKHLPLKQKFISQGMAEVDSVDQADFILAFCVIVSRVGTDMEAALKLIPDMRPAILVVMHHTFDPDYVIPDTNRFARGRDITVVDILFHEDKGILMSQKNREAEHKMLGAVRTQIPASSSTKQKNKKSSISSQLPAVATRPKEDSRNSVSSLSSTSGKVKYFTLVSEEHCEFILAFCPVVSSVQLDIERACKRIPDSKAAILVVMHHTFDPDHVPVEGSGFAKRSDLFVVHCLFHEDQGFLKCYRNDEAVGHIITWLQENFPNSVNNPNISNIGSGWLENLKSHFPSISWPS